VEVRAWMPPGRSACKVDQETLGAVHLLPLPPRVHTPHPPPRHPCSTSSMFLDIILCYGTEKTKEHLGLFNVHLLPLPPRVHTPHPPPRHPCSTSSMFLDTVLL
jgi:hypothetical protein